MTLAMHTDHELLPFVNTLTGERPLVVFKINTAHTKISMRFFFGHPPGHACLPRGEFTAISCACLPVFAPPTSRLMTTSRPR